MRAILIVLFISLAACGGSSAPDPNAKLQGDWNAATMNGSPLPATYDFGLLHYRVVSRRLTLIGTGGFWNDSTVLTTDGPAGGQFDASRSEFIKWSLNGNGMTVLGATPSSQLALFFIVQPDGTLVSDFNDGMTVVYRK